MGDNVSYEKPGEGFYRPIGPEATRIIGRPILDVLNSMFPKYESEQPKTESDSDLVDRLIREGSPAARLYSGSDSR